MRSTSPRRLEGFNTSARTIVATAFSDGQDHPSPNGGLIGAAFAASLGVQLGGSNVYDGKRELRATLGTGAPPATRDIERAVALSNRTVEVLVGASLGSSAVFGLANALRARRRQRP